ncbi:hypothetical protein DENIS_3367 [Desulfonema ishimotonii]|uniref:Uncharacterized protein n=1 Tax=Desulfonema ishimotonii TaxID=45657 RepID=A0A401FZJ9_9BACT|nr:hypothetical protein DENIS_3367 [Desulfonema ishimotonii]
MRKHWQGILYSESVKLTATAYQSAPDGTGTEAPPFLAGRRIPFRRAENQANMFSGI